MKKLLYLLPLTLLIFGCQPATTTTPPAALAPGYSSTDDMKLGQSLAAVCSPTGSFVAQEKINYAALSPNLQAAEKPYLNNLIATCNSANQIYLAFHAGTATLVQAQTAFATAQSAQTALAANKGVK